MDGRRKGLRRAAWALGAAVAGAGLVVPATAAEPGADSRAAYRFEFEDVNPKSDSRGRRLRLDDLRAERGVVLNFIASWCGPCWQEAPSFERLHAAHETPIVFVAADEYGPPDDLLRLAARAKLTLPILLVPQDQIETMEQHYDHDMLPSTYLVGKDGAILSTLLGLVPEKILFEEIRRQLP
jgi:thiol-disulfide isomerase/thioredoxin